MKLYDTPATASQTESGSPASGPGLPSFGPAGGVAVWDEEAVRFFLKEAADTLRRLPSTMIRPRLSYWPDVVVETSDFIGSGSKIRPAAPRPAAIDRLDSVLEWLLVCDDEERRLVWARACRLPWRRLSEMDGRSHMTLRKVEARGVAAILAKLRDPSQRKQLDNPLWQRK